MRFGRICAVVVLLGWCAQGKVFGQRQFEVVALDGDPMPGVDPPTTFGPLLFGDTAINGGGLIAFTADRCCPANRSGVWFGRPGDIRAVAVGEQQVDIDERSYWFGDNFHMLFSGTGEGTFAFLGGLQDGPGGAGAGGLFNIDVDGNPTLVGLEYGPAKAHLGPDYPGVEGFHTGYEMRSPSGLMVVWTNDLDGEELLAGRLGSLVSIAKSGGPAVGDGGNTFLSFPHLRAINDRGHVAFTAILEGPGISSEDNTGVWLAKDGELELLVLAGRDVVPEYGLLIGVQTGSSLGPLAISYNDDVAFVGYFRDQSGSVTQRLLVANSEGVSAVKIKGVVADLYNGPLEFWSRPRFLGFLSDARLLVCYVGCLVGAPDALEPYLDAPDALEPSLGNEQSVYYDGPQSFSVDGIGNLNISNSGIVAFLDERGLLAGPPCNLQRVVGIGDEVLLGPNDIRSVEAVSFSARGTYFEGFNVNDSGQVIFRLTFEVVRGVRERTSGVFVASVSTECRDAPAPAPTPEPEPEPNQGGPIGQGGSAPCGAMGMLPLLAMGLGLGLLSSRRMVRA